MKGYNRFGKTLRWIFKAVKPRWRVDTGDIPDEPVAFIVHHQNMFGPIHAIGLLPRETHMWSLYVFRDRKTCFDQFYNYTYTQRYGWPKPVAWTMASLLSVIVPLLLQSVDVIPVYHDARAMTTIRTSIKALQQNRSLTICPDVDYSSDDAALGETYTGFLLLGRQYHRQTGNELKYVPTYVSRSQKRIVFGKPLCVDITGKAAEATASMAAELRDCLNSLGVACGDIVPTQKAGSPQ